MKNLLWLPPVFFILAALVSCEKRSALTHKNVVIYERYEKNEGDEEGEPGGDKADNSSVVLENDFLELSFSPGTAEIVIREKESGVVWRSSPENAAEDPAADPVTEQLMRSQFFLEYANVAGVGMTLYSGSDSVEQEAYNYEIRDNGLEVHYTVGNLTRAYQLPVAAPEARMLSFLEKMERGDRRKVEASYRLYDIDNLRPGDDKNALLSTYPDLARGRVYVMRDTTQEYMKIQIEEFFIAAGYTYDDYIEDTSRYSVSSVDEKPAFNVTIRYELDGNSLVVSAPFDKIAYRPAYPITRLGLLPFFGAGGLEDSGYLLVPDGSGALMYFNNGKNNQIPYNNNTYGWDEGLSREAVIYENRAPFPCFGIQKNGAALLCVIEEGSAYSSIRADVSGRNCSYNSVFAQFALIHGEKMDISGRSDRAVYLYERSLPEGERIAQRFIFCAEEGYVGMAKEYRSYLRNRHPELSPSVDGGVPVVVEIVGAVNKTQHRLGIPFDLPLPLTSFKEAQSMIQDFADFGWKNARIKLIGWFNGSVDHAVPSKISLIKTLGSGRDFMNLAAAARERDYGFYVEADFLFMRDNSVFDNFSLYRDAARYVSRDRIESYPYSFVWFGERTQWGKLSYLARPDYMMKLIDGFVDKATGLGVENFAFRTIGSKLAGDYNEKRLVSREASMNMQREKLSELKRKGKGVLVNTGFVYTAPYADIITDMTTGDQGFGITDEAVPFYQIALHGLVPYTGKAINLAEDYTKNLLESIASGAGLYFSFMTEEVAALQETKFRQFYANEYGKWANDAAALYKQFERDFDGLYGQEIKNHETLSPGVTVTEYDDGTLVVVNSGDDIWHYNGAAVAANNYAVIR
ncbi:MAG: DUF5696 domain-containing protein [Treponema sp.]|jgi:hypothetical protein|nr:DUF5696 domain-containing protein [Treponema sp.]